MSVVRPEYLYPTPGRVALVLAGGAARGAYEVGVVQYIAEELARDLGRDPPIDILCGTSVGAINGCALAALADAPRSRARKLAEVWKNLQMEEVIRLRPAYVARFLGGLVGRAVAFQDAIRHRYGGLLDPRGLEDVIRRDIAFPRIQGHIDSGLLHAVTVSATHIATGNTVVFVSTRDKREMHWSSDRKVICRHAELRMDHALASAAIPLMFPAVRVGTEFFCDGGLRQNVPLSPARHLGADGVLVINPRYVYERPQAGTPVEAGEDAVPGPWFLVGKALNALLLDRVENDIERMQRINSMLLAGQRRFGPGFVQELNQELGKNDPERQLRTLATLLIDASANIGKLAADYVRSPTFARRNRGVFARVLRSLVDDQFTDESDLLSYVLFDGEFVAQLIDLGRHDAQRRHAELRSFFTTLTV
jgi:NTE family protein